MTILLVALILIAYVMGSGKDLPVSAPLITHQRTRRPPVTRRQIKRARRKQLADLRRVL